MSIAALTKFFESELQDCKAKGLMVSLHLKVVSFSSYHRSSFFLLKATMMKISDPIIFGHMVKVYYSGTTSSQSHLQDKTSAYSH